MMTTMTEMREIDREEMASVDGGEMRVVNNPLGPPIWYEPPVPHPLLPLRPPNS